MAWADVIPELSKVTVCAAPYWFISALTTGMGTWLMFMSPDCKCDPAVPLYAASRIVLEESCRCTEKVQTSKSGARVALEPFHQSTLPLLEKAGLICGGSGYDGNPWSQLKAGVMPVLV